MVASKSADRKAAKKAIPVANERTHARIEPAQRLFLQHHQMARTPQGILRTRIAGQVAIEVGSGQHDGQGALRMRRMKARNRVGRAARMQRDHRVQRLAVPVERHVDPCQRREEVLPARGGVGIAVVRRGQGRRDDAHAWSVHGRDLATGRAVHG